jgi:hypothetical protein
VRVGGWVGGGPTAFLTPLLPSLTLVKADGRVGEAALFGAGCWANNGDCSNDNAPHGGGGDDAPHGGGRERPCSVAVSKLVSVP